MGSLSNFHDTGNIIATIENRENPGQIIAIKYAAEDNAFVSSGIRAQLGCQEILIPVHLVAVDFQLMGTIIAAILEKISSAHEMERTFHYPSRLEVMGKVYTMTEYGDYMKMEEA